MTTKALTRETDTHEHTAASRSGHTTIWLESLSKFGPFTVPYMARAEECLLKALLSLSDSVCVHDVIWLCVWVLRHRVSPGADGLILQTGFIQVCFGADDKARCFFESAAALTTNELSPSWVC